MSPPLLSGPPDAKSSSRFVAKTLGLVGAVVLLTLGAAIGAMVWSTDVANRQEAQRQRARVETALSGELVDSKRQLQALLSAPGLRRHLNASASGEAMVGALAELFQHPPIFDGVLIADQASKVKARFPLEQPNGTDDNFLIPPSIVDPSSHSSREATFESSDTSAKNTTSANATTSRLIFSNGRLFTVTSARLVPLEDDPNHASFVVTGYRRVTDSHLIDIAERHSIAHLELKAEPPADGLHAIALENAAGSTAAWLVWSSERPGDGVLLSFIVVIVLSLGICLSVFVAIVNRLRRSALQMAMREDEIQRLAGHDPLSGLPNRKAFETTIDRELVKLANDGGGFAVHFLDLDKFKAVNDTYGHKAGDELIRQVAKRLTDLLRGADTLVRFGGDEFAIVQTEVAKAGEAAMLGQRILEALTRPFTIDDVQVLIGVSIGISLAPQNGTDRETLANLADTALYQAKNEGRNRYNFFEKIMDKSLHLRRVVEDDLRNAIDNDDLTLHYQPQISADGQTIVGIEALVRWPHAVHGMIPPTEFIPIAEERGLIMQLSDWVLRRACTDGLRWPGLRLAVNVSPIQFRHHEFVANVAAVLSETGFDGSRLEIELTEGVVVDDADKAEAAMVELRALGVGLALDDFGTGYSSLIYLRRFAFDKIKIDRSFLEYMETTGESAILVHSVVHLGRALGLRVCAEGVETAEQHRFLQAVGCHELQGFFFSPPVPADAIDHLLSLDHPFAARTV